MPERDNLLGLTIARMQAPPIEEAEEINEKTENE